MRLQRKEVGGGVRSEEDQKQWDGNSVIWLQLKSVLTDSNINITTQNGEL